MASLPKQLRMAKFEELYLTGVPPAQIADRLGVSLKTINRYVAQRRTSFLAHISEKQAIIFDLVLRESYNDLIGLKRIIDEEEAGLVTTDAYGKRVQILRNLIKFSGVEQPIKNLHQHVHLNNKTELSLNGPVQIIVEQDGGGKFDTAHGNGRVRVDSPSADEITSASG